MNNNTAHETITSRDGRLVTGLFADRDRAERAYRELAARGYSSDDVTVMMSDEARTRHFAEHAVASDNALGHKVAEGGGVGAGIGGAIGAVLAGVAAIGTTLVLPGLGVVVAGPIMAALVGAGAGGITGGLVGALVGAGIPDERVRHYDEGIRNGGIVLAVRALSDDDADEIARAWTSHGEHIVGLRAHAGAPPAGMPMAGA